MQKHKTRIEVTYSLVWRVDGEWQVTWDYELKIRGDDILMEGNDTMITAVRTHPYRERFEKCQDIDDLIRTHYSL